MGLNPASLPTKSSQPAKGPDQQSPLHTADAWRSTTSRIRRELNKLLGLVKLASYRLIHYPELSTLALLGVILAVGLVTSAGFFAQAVDKVILEREMDEYTRITNRPPFSARVYTFSSSAVPLTIERALALGENVGDTLSSEIGLPVKSIGFFANSDAFELRSERAGDEGQRAPGSNQSTSINFMVIQDVGPRMELIDGSAIDEGASDSVLEVWILESFANEIGAEVGQEYELGPRSDEFVMDVRVAGIWRPINEEDSFWINKPNQALADKLLVREQDYVNFIEPLLDVKVRAVSWPVVLDESKVIPARVRDYAEGYERGEAVILKYLPDAQLTVPSVSLDKFVQRQTALTTILLGFNVPALGFLLYFLILTSVVIAYWQRRETMVLIRRGMTRFEIFNLTFIESLILFLVGCPIGLAFGILLARMMGYTVSFLEFTVREPLPVSIYGLNMPLILLTLGILLVARLGSVASVDRSSIVSQEREHARPQRPPFWYRNYLDMLLIIPTAYAYQQLNSRGSLALLIDSRPEDMFRDPLLVVVPALFILTLALISMRVFMLIMRLLDKVAGLIPALTPHLALRQLGRQGHTYINPLLLVIVSLGLGVYTLSMAASLDQWVIDRMYHSAGADISFEPFLESVANSTSAESSAVGAEWIPPASDYQALEGIQAAARVGDYRAFVRVGESRIDGRFLGVDRIDFPLVAWFRNDFATESLGALMNRLALLQDGVLVSREFLEEHNLSIGDQIEIQVLAAVSDNPTSIYTIAGLYEYFPTVYEDQITVIGNLEHVFALYGVTMPHNVWLRTENGADGEEVIEILSETGVESIREMDAQGLISEEQAKMERVGVFGTLSVGFLAAALMAAMGLLTYSYASLQDRRLNFALLRASGLGRFQILGQVALEYAILTAYGALAGVVIGSLTSEFFVPLFRITAEGGSLLPPLLPIIEQERIIPLAIIFAGLMILFEVILISIALQRRLFDALRMGM